MVSQYPPIEPLPPEASRWQHLALRGLEREWRDERSRIESAGSLGPFLTRLRREWAIETGIIERLYYWDRGVTELLIEQGVDAAIIAHRTPVDRVRADAIKAMIDDHEAVLEGLFGFVDGQQTLTEHYIRSLHQALTRGQETTLVQDAAGNRFQIPLERGVYKHTPNNPRRLDGSVHEYCPPELVIDEMQRLVEWCGSVVGPSEVVAAWLHHRFTAIHPFQDGNGRVARALASILFIQAGLFPLIIRDSDRSRYIGALESADAGELGPLANLFGERQAATITQALRLESDASASDALERIVAAGARVLRERSDPSPEHQRVLALMDPVRQVIGAKLDDLVAILNRGVGPGTASRGSDGGSRAKVLVSHGLHPSSVIVGFKPLTLQIATDPRYALDVEVVPIDNPFVGVAVAVAGVRFGQAIASAVRWDPPEAIGTPLRFSYAEEADAVRLRASEWIDGIAVLTMEHWRRSLTVPST